LKEKKKKFIEKTEKNKKFQKIALKKCVFDV